MPQQPEPPRRYACTYMPDDGLEATACRLEATTTVVINGQARAVCEWCKLRELREQAKKRDRQARREASA